MGNRENITGNKRLLINMSSSVASYSSTILISFVLTPYLINTLGKEAYSFYPLANNFVNYMSVLTNALNSMASRFITIEIAQKKYDEANRYFSSILFANMIMTAILFLPMVLIVIFLDKVLQVPINLIGSIKLLFAFVFASMLVNVVTSVFGVATFAKNRIDLRSISELVTAILRITLFVIFFKFFRPEIFYVGIVALIISLVNFVFQTKFTRLLLPEIHISKNMFSKNYVKIILSSGIWNSVNQIGALLLSSTSLLMANILYGASASGSYSIVQTVPNFINGLVSMLASVFVPIVIYKYAQKDKDGMLNELKKSQKLIGVFSTSVIAVFIGLSYEFFTMWTPNEDPYYLFVLSTVTILPHFIIGSVWPVSNLNVVMNRVKFPAIYMLCSGLTNIFTVIVVYKIASPSVISIPIISAIIQLIWVGIFIPQYPCAQLQISRYYFYPPIVKSLFGGIISIFFTYFVKRFFPVTSWVMLFTVGIFCGLFAIFLNFCMQFGIKETGKKIIVLKNKMKNTVHVK